MSEKSDAHSEKFIVCRNFKSPVGNMVKLKTSLGDTICIQNLSIIVCKTTVLCSLGNVNLAMFLQSSLSIRMENRTTHCLGTREKDYEICD